MQRLLQPEEGYVILVGVGVIVGVGVDPVNAPELLRAVVLSKGVFSCHYLRFTHIAIVSHSLTFIEGKRPMFPISE